MEKKEKKATKKKPVVKKTSVKAVKSNKSAKKAVSIKKTKTAEKKEIVSQPKEAPSKNASVAEEAKTFSIPTPEEMLAAGVHFGHQIRRWHPSMAPYIFSKSTGIHVIDLFITEKKLKEACDFLYETAKSGGTILFVGTKRQAQDIVKEYAEKSGALYMTNRWIGGTLTNFSEIRKNIDRLKDLIKQREEGSLSHYTKKEQLLIDREIKKLNFMVGGISSMKELPSAIFIVDVKKEKTAYREAARTGIKIVSLNDTNNDISKVTYPIPGNDDAIKAILLVVKTVAEAVRLGYNKHSKEKAKGKA